MLIRKVPVDDRERQAIGSRVPVPFVVGVARSGTTLLTHMLDAHPDLAIPVETHFIPRLVAACQTSSDAAQTFVELIRSSPKWPSFQIDELVFGEEIARINPFDVGAGLRVFFGLYARRHNKPRWGDKTPPYVVHMKLIQDVLPEVRFVHIVRDGRDVALSLNNHWIGPDTVHGAAEMWTMQLWRARAQVDELHYYLEVRFEDLIDDAEGTLRQVCKFIELPWNPLMLRYHERIAERDAERELATRPPEIQRAWDEATARKARAALSKPPQGDRVGVWKRDMTPDDRAKFEDIAGDTLASFGYEVLGADDKPVRP